MSIISRLNLVAKNPNPDKITDEMWRLKEEIIDSVPHAVFSGIYAVKKGYHESVNYNLENYPKNYSVEVPLDLVKYNRDKSRAIDISFPEDMMQLVTHRMRLSALNKADNRLAAVREFYGTLDGERVYGLIKDDENGPWEGSSADKSHLSHLHISLFTAFVSNWKMLAPIISVLSGQTFIEWKAGDMSLPKLGDIGEDVGYWQSVHNTIAASLQLKTLDVDKNYGPKTAAAVAEFYTAVSGKTDYDGNAVTAWIAIRYHSQFVKVVNPQETVPTPVIVQAVEDWLRRNFNTSELKLTGTIEGKIDLNA